VMSLWISPSSVIDGWNICGCEAAMVWERDYGEHRKTEREMAVEDARIGFPIQSPFKGGIGEGQATIGSVKP
jgi:hypothetical protein